MAVDTTVTSVATVTLTAGTLADISACVTEVGTKLNRGTLGASTNPTSTQVQSWIVRAKEELGEVYGFYFNRVYAYFDTIAADYKYGLPDAYEIFSLRDTTNNLELERLNSFQFTTKYPDPSEEANAAPAVWCRKGGELWLAPPPDAVYRIEVEYSRTSADSTATSISYIPEAYRWALCDFACAEAFEALDQLEKATYFRSKWESCVGKGRRASARHKWAASGHQALSWQQWYTARSNQYSGS